MHCWCWAWWRPACPPTAVAQSPPTVPLSTPPVRDTEMVVMTGASFPSWAAPADVNAAAPSLEGLQCLGEENGVPASDLGDSPATDDDPCTHNSFDEPLVSSQAVVGAEGVPVDRLLAYRWDGEAFVQVPFQVDEMFTRHLSNNASGFAAFSERDRHDSYVFDREGFRWTASDPDDPCLAAPASEPAADPVPGLDTDDELVFMARDAGVQAPADAPLPAGIADAFEVTVTDPFAPATPALRLRRTGGGGRPHPRLRRHQRLRPLPARRRREPSSCSPSRPTRTTATPPTGPGSIPPPGSATATRPSGASTAPATRRPSPRPATGSGTRVAG